MIAVGRLVEVVLSGLFLGWYLFWICWLGDVELNVGCGVVYMIFRVLGCWGLLGGGFWWVSCCLQFGDFLAWCWDSGICAGVSWCNISCRVIPVLGWVWLFGEFGCFVVILFEWCWFIVPWRVIVWWGFA